MGHLNQLQEKYYDKGLRVIAISPEPMNTIKKRFVEGEGAKYWLGSDPGRATVSQFGGGGIPHAYLIDASGKVVLNIHPGNLPDSRIEALLDGVFDPALGRTLHGKLKSAVKSYEKGDVGKAYAATARLLEDADREVVGDAEFLRGKCDAWAGFRKKLVDESVKSKDFDTAYADLKEIAKAFAGMETAKWAAETKGKLDADPEVARERKAWKSYLKAQAKEEKAGGKAKKMGPARTAYRSIVKKYAGTRAAKLAEQALKRIGG